MAHVATIDTDSRCRDTSRHRAVGVGTAAAAPPSDRLPTWGAVTEVHDSFTGVEFIRYEDLGFAERFGGHAQLEAEVTTIGGRLPVHTSGAGTAEGHPPVVSVAAQSVTAAAPTRASAVTTLEGPIAHGR
ncbi:hypothetical protein DVS77_10905 [Mycolicibacterium moriokaense]|nr:hypothetical protein DVS77_10905 [Mycolicibacterium moriokaense]